MDVAQFLNDVAGDLVKAGVHSRRLSALAFEADGMDIAVRTARTEHVETYPPLGDILDRVGRHCLAEGIAVEQLRQITFLDEEINLEVASRHGQPAIHSYLVGSASVHAQSTESRSRFLGAWARSPGTREHRRSPKADE